MIKTKISHITQRQRDQYVLSRRRCSTCDHGKVNVISSCDLDWCRFKQTVCVDLCAPFAHVALSLKDIYGCHRCHEYMV